MKQQYEQILNDLAPTKKEKQIIYLEVLVAQAAKARGDIFYDLENTEENRDLVFKANVWAEGMNESDEEAIELYRWEDTKTKIIYINSGTLASYFIKLLEEERKIIE